jgi:choline dehydrogenase-like flavoprotein
MGKDSNEGIVISMEQIFKENNDNEVYDGLYVVDASIIPTPLGLNHSFTLLYISI